VADNIEPEVIESYIDQVTLPDGKKYTLTDSTLSVYSGTCTTTGSQAIKEVACPIDFTELINGMVIFVTFSETNTVISNLKLKINTTDAKPIKYQYNASVIDLPSANYL